MAGKNRSGQAWKTGYTSYKAANKYGKNRERDLKRHLANHPDDAVATAALKNIRYRRKAPKKAGGWVTGAVMFSMLEHIGAQTNPCLRGSSVKMDVWFAGAQTKKNQMDLARYMKLSRKSANEAMYAKKNSA